MQNNNNEFSELDHFDELEFLELNLEIQNNNLENEEDDDEEYEDDEEGGGGIPLKAKIIFVIIAVLCIIALVVGYLFTQSTSKKQFNSSEIVGHSHVYAKEKTVVKEPSCSEAGILAKICTFQNGCDAYIEPEDIEKLEHEYDDGHVLTEPTCSADGQFVYTCIHCGDEKFERLLKIDHAFGSGEVLQEGDCEKGIITKYKCTMCNFEKEEESKPTGHVLNATVYEDSSEENYTQYFRTCKNCDAYVYTDVNGSPNGKVVSRGEVVSERGGNVNISDDDDRTNCEKHGHEYREAFRTQPTCTTPGSIHYACVFGDSSRDEMIPTIPHDLAEYKTEATCSKEGVIETKCAKCGYVESTKTIAKLHHSFTTGTTVTQETCGKDGVIRYTCNTCGFVEDRSVPATKNHTYVQREIEENGTRFLEEACSVCGQVKSKTMLTD